MTDLARLARAADLAARIHAGQRRRGGDVPYVNHVIEVALLLAEDGADEGVVVAGLLHDVVEDGEIDLDQIGADFGPTVRDLVDAMTDAPDWEDLPRPERKRLQADHIRTASAAARRIKIADQCANVRDISRLPDAWAPGEAAEYLDGAERVVAACRGVSAGLEAAFDAAAAEAMQKIGSGR